MEETNVRRNACQIQREVAEEMLNVLDLGRKHRSKETYNSVRRMRSAGLTLDPDRSSMAEKRTARADGRFVLVDL